MYMPTASGGPGVAQRERGAVTVGIIPDRPGQLLRQALQDRFERTEHGVAHKYDLAVAYEIEGEGIAILHDNTTTRIRLTGRAQWTLRAQDVSRTVLATGTARSLDAVNVLKEQYFAADLGNEAAQVRIANAVADQITGQLAAFFNRRAAGTA
jgi:LPS-assembly lipoprotein